MTRFYFEILEMKRFFISEKLIWIIVNLNFIDYTFKMTRFHFEILGIKRVSLFLERKVICVI